MATIADMASMKHVELASTRAFMVLNARAASRLVVPNHGFAAAVLDAFATLPTTSRASIDLNANDPAA